MKSIVSVKMFGKTIGPQSKSCVLTAEQIAKDVKAVSSNEVHRNKLYQCLNMEPPQNNQLLKIEDFLKGTDNLEDIKGQLESLIDQVEGFVQRIGEDIENIEKKASECKN
ncbi:hypothetical protein ABEB36_011677 [Hypothenemus hampei]|uniref:Uncharacterized protein n=1 Tax=Hypothenemus hampei TaxID=57062 RepID=A0ABD1E8M2_HYPHA